MKRLLALTSSALLLSCFAAPAHAATPAPRMMQFRFADHHFDVPKEMIVRVWTPDGKSSSALRCAQTVGVVHGQPQLITMSPPKKCAASPLPKRVKVTTDVAGTFMVFTLWSPDGKTSTQWRCTKLTLDPPGSEETPWWVRGKCSVV